MNLVFRNEDAERVKQLFAENIRFTRKQFDPEEKGLPSMPPYSEKSFPLRADQKAHPRLLLTREMIPKILQQAETDEAREACRVMMENMETEVSGILPPLHENERGLYTLDNHILIVIQAKALAYLLSGNREYGLEAIIAIKNYLLTMEIRWLKNDICRHYGYAMYMAACVWDWCYDLLTEEDKYQIQCGVGYNMCQGITEGVKKAAYESKVERVKMEMGFPPAKQTAITGHGCELQLMRDYLSFSMVIYEQDPSWWNFTAARFYAEYPRVRSLYFASDMYPQGTQYSPFRMVGDLWAVWILKNLTGENPYEEEHMKKVMPSLLGFEIVNGTYFRAGDDAQENGDSLYAAYSYDALLSAYLFHDPTMKAWAKYLKLGYSDFTPENQWYKGAPNAITPAEFLILHSDGTKPALDLYEGMPYLQHNGGMSQVTIARNSRQADAAVVFMRGAGRSTANHDHQDAATFQIAYKGLICGDSGTYETYRSAHHFYYHQATLAHNGILVYNPEWEDRERVFNENGRPLNNMRYYYSGGQRVIDEARTLETWFTPEYDMGYPLGIAFGYEEKDPHVPHFAYTAYDYTQAYHASTVEKIQRHMLAVFTGVTEMPLLMFVYDDVRARSGSFRKAFLLQCSERPEVDLEKKRLQIIQGEGKLILQNLQGADKIEIFGGPEKQFWNARDGKEGRGINIDTMVPGASSNVWGHAELVAPDGENDCEYWNLLLAADRDQSPEYFSEKWKNEELEGITVTIQNHRWVFAKIRKEALEELTISDQLISKNGMLTEYYLFNIHEGCWDIDEDGIGRWIRKVGKDENLLYLKSFSKEIRIRKIRE